MQICEKTSIYQFFEIANVQGNKYLQFCVRQQHELVYQTHSASILLVFDSECVASQICANNMSTTTINIGINNIDKSNSILAKIILHYSSSVALAPGYVLLAWR
jgi:hypothetical protein